MNQPAATIDMTLVDDVQLLRRNRKGLLIEGGNVSLVVEFSVHDTIMNPGGWQALVATAVEFVRGAQPTAALPDDDGESLRAFAAEKERQLYEQMRSPDA